MRANVLGFWTRLSKVRAMSPGEIVSRVQYRVTTALERDRHRRGVLAEPGRLGKALVTSLRADDWRQRLLSARRTSSGRFLAGVYERDHMRRLFAGPFSAELQDTLVHAALAREQRFEFFGHDLHYAGDIDWQLDPVTKRRWPSVYHADVPVHGGDLGFGDVKHVWELSRQQYLIDLAKAWYLTGNRPDLATMSHLVSSWIAGNPYGTGVNWSCALEPAFRAWSWLWAYHLTADALDDEFHLEWLQGFYDHGRFLSAHLELYSSPYNHLIGEASALYVLGACFPEFEEAAHWRRQGRQVLEERLRDQFYADGGSVEQSPFYHHATTGFYLLAALVARANGEDLSAAVWQAINRALEFSMLLTQPDGRTPEIGGADDGKPIRMEHLPFWDFRPYLAIGAVLFGRADYRKVAGRFYEDALWLLGPGGREAFDRIEGAGPAMTSAVLQSSGYVVSRSSWECDADYVCFDVGEQAAGMRVDAVPNSMHGHADCLSLIVSLGGRRVLVDSGLYAYNCGGKWEAHFRETAAHNTARIDGRDQALHIGKMAWSHSYRPTLEASMSDTRQAWASGSHDGYARGPTGVTHRRTIWRRPGSYVLVHDEFTGSGSHEIEVNYQFAPGNLQLTDARALFDGFAELSWIGDREWTAETRCGGPTPADGWICTSLGVRRAAPRLTLKTQTDASRTSLLTVITNGPSRLMDLGVSGGLVAVAGEGWTDWITAAGITTATAMETDARLAVCRIADDEVERVLAHGTELRVDAAQLQRLSAQPPRPVGAR